MTQLQTFLRSGGTPDELLARYAIKATRHREIPSLVLFKYNQINSPFAEPIVRECRGIVLDESDGWRVVSRAFDKFFNHGEGHAAAIDWSTARVQEKVDGSLCVLYSYRGEWRVATSGMPDAGGEVNGCGFTFADLFWRTFRAMDLPLPVGNADLCFAFELTSPWNRIVVRHAEPSLVLLAVRDRVTGAELPVEAFSARYPVVRSFPLQTIGDVLATFEHMDPVTQEGFVIVDGAFNRIKVKHPGYVAIHHARDGMSPKRILEIVRSGESSELLTHFPEWRPEFDRVREALESLIADVLADFERLRGIPEQKAFALEALKTRCSSALFLMRAGKIGSLRQWLADMPIDRLMDLLRLKDEPAAEAA